MKQEVLMLQKELLLSGIHTKIRDTPRENHETYLTLQNYNAISNMTTFLVAL